MTNWVVAFIYEVWASKWNNLNPAGRITLPEEEDFKQCHPYKPLLYGLRLSYLLLRPIVACTSFNAHWQPTDHHADLLNWFLYVPFHCAITIKTAGSTLRINCLILTVIFGLLWMLSESSFSHLLPLFSKPLSMRYSLVGQSY